MSQISNVYEDVPGLGKVIVSTHAIEKARHAGINEFHFKKALFSDDIIQEGDNIIWKEAGRVRLIILTKPDKRAKKLAAAKLVKTMFIIEPQKIARR